MNIKVAIRVRPFNNREKKLKTDLCVKMQDQSTVVFDKKGKEIKNYSFDYCFWSHNGFKIDENGYSCQKSNSKYADQKIVFDCLG